MTMKEWIAEKIEEALHNYFSGMKERALENLETLGTHIINALDEASYLLALYGGGALIIAKICGSTRAKKYFFGVQLLHIFIKGLL